MGLNAPCHTIFRIVLLVILMAFATASVPALAQENLNDIQSDQKFKDDALAKELIDARKRKDKGKFQSLLNQYLRQADQNLASVPPTSKADAGILVRECSQGSLDAAIGDCLDYLDPSAAAAYQNSYWAMKRALSVLMVAEAAGLNLGSRQDILGPISSKLKNSVYNPPTSGTKNSASDTGNDAESSSEGKLTETPNSMDHGKKEGTSTENSKLPLEGSAIAAGGQGTGSRHGDIWSAPAVEEKKPVGCDVVEGVNGNCRPPKPVSQNILPSEIKEASDSLVKSKLKIEAAKYLAAGQIQAYMRQVAIAGVSKEEFEQEINKLLRQCKSDSPISDPLIKITSGALGSYNQEVSDPKKFAELHRKAAAQNAIRLAALENDLNALKQDFDQVPPSVARLVEGNLALRLIPGLKSFAKLADEGGVGVRQKLANNKQRPCGSQSLSLVNVGTHAQFAHDENYSDADKVLMSNHEFPVTNEKPASSSFYERCKIKEAWMQNKVQEMSRILAQYPELGSEVPNKPGLSVYQMINTRLPGSTATYGVRGTEEALEKVIAERNKDEGTVFKDQGILPKIRENIKNICDDPEGAGTALFKNDTLLRKFLSCNGQAPLPATENNISNTGNSPYKKNCEEIRKSSEFACEIRQDKELRDFGLETAMGTFDMGMDLIGANSLGKALAQETGTTFFKSLGTGFKEAALSPGTYIGMGVGVGVGGYFVNEARKENIKAESEFFAGQAGHEQAVASRNAYGESKNGLITDTVLGAIIPQGHGPGKGVELPANKTRAQRFQAKPPADLEIHSIENHPKHVEALRDTTPRSNVSKKIDEALAAHKLLVDLGIDLDGAPLSPEAFQHETKRFNELRDATKTAMLKRAANDIELPPLTLNPEESARMRSRIQKFDETWSKQSGNNKGNISSLKPIKTEKPLNGKSTASVLKIEVIENGKQKTLFARPITPENAEAARKALASSEIVNTLGVKSFPESKLTWIDTPKGKILAVVSESAPGETPRVFDIDLKTGKPVAEYFKNEPDGQTTTGTVHLSEKSLSNLQAVEYLKGESDGHLKNYHVDPKTGQIQGFDANNSFAPSLAGDLNRLPQKYQFGAFLPERYSREFVDGLKTKLTPQYLEKELKHLSPDEIKAVIARREILLADIEHKGQAGIIESHANPKTFEDGHSFLAKRTDLPEGDRKKLAKALQSAEEKATKNSALADSIERAHEIGAENPGQYSPADIKEKTKILKNAGFNELEREALLRSGVTGDFDKLRIDLRKAGAHRIDTGFIEVSPGEYAVATPGRIAHVGDAQFISYEGPDGVRRPAKVSRMDIGHDGHPLVEVELVNGSKFVLDHNEVQSARPSSSSKSQFLAKEGPKDFKPPAVRIGEGSPFEAVRNRESSLSPSLHEDLYKPFPGTAVASTDSTLAHVAEEVAQKYKREGKHIPDANKAAQEQHPEFRQRWLNEKAQEIYSLPLEKIKKDPHLSALPEKKGTKQNVYLITKEDGSQRVFRPIRPDILNPNIKEVTKNMAARKTLGSSMFAKLIGYKNVPESRLIKFQDPYTGQIMIGVESVRVSGNELGLLPRDIIPPKQLADIKAYEFLIGNADGRGTNFFYSSETRMIHSFDADAAFNLGLPPQMMKDYSSDVAKMIGFTLPDQVSREFVHNLEQTTPEMIKKTMRGTLSEQEIEHVLFRRDVLLSHIKNKGAAGLID